MKSHFFPSFIVYLVLHFSEVRKCRINWQSQANETNKQKNRVTPARDSVFTVTVKHIVAHGAVSARWYPGKYGLWQFSFLNCSKKRKSVYESALEVVLTERPRSEANWVRKIGRKRIHKVRVILWRQEGAANISIGTCRKDNIKNADPIKNQIRNFNKGSKTKRKSYLRQVRLRLRGSWLGKSVNHNVLTLSDYSKLAHFWEVCN